MISILGRLYITASSSHEKLQMAFDLATEALESKVASDAPSRNAIIKVHGALGKAIGDTGKHSKSSLISKEHEVAQGFIEKNTGDDASVEGEPQIEEMTIGGVTTFQKQLQDSELHDPSDEDGVT